MIDTDRFAKVEIASLAELRLWLERNHTQQNSVWLVRYKKQTPDKFVDRLDALDELLCFGWIDGLARVLDDTRTMQLISPRRHQVWALSYKQRAERLISEGRMHASGFSAIESSKQQGLWDAMADVDALEMPDDLVVALEAMPPAKGNFAASAPSYRRNVLRWLKQVKTPETRLKRILAITDHAARNQKVPQM
jgi:uncharacterized protein YdeI (YjbR/CyaY-like superfamily)